MVVSWQKAALVGLALVIALASPPTGEGTSPAAETIRVAVFSDFNGPYGSTSYHPTVSRVITRITTVWKPDLVLSAGDMIAGQHLDLPSTRFAEMWEAFDAFVGRPLRRAGIPFGFALGNHDASAARTATGAYLFARERDYAAAYWRDPAHRPLLEFVDAQSFPFSYSFVHSGIFFVAVDATTHVIQDAPWVLAALGSTSASAARMRIVLGHLPLFGISEGRSKSGETVEQGEAWRQRFEASGVDLYLSGHHAAYYPAHRGRLRLLHSGAGVGARKYVGYPQVPARSTVTLMQFDLRTRGIVLETYDVATEERIELSELPPCISGYNGPVFRLDVPQGSSCPRR